MQGMKDVWDIDALGIVQNVGYPNQNRSHFRSTDIWNTGSSAETLETKGWIGKMYDLDYSNYPNGYPNSTNPHPFALTMGKIVSETCQGINANYSLSLLDPFNPGTALVSAGGNIPSNCYGDSLTFVNDTVSQTNAYASVISTAANAGNNLSPKWSSLTTDLSEKLKNVARLISGGLKTKIYVVQLGGFDTHDNQTVAGAPTTGIHSNLLKELSDAVCAFQDDLNLLNVNDKVVGMTYSEFGRRIRSNAALGTDHGTAAPLFLFGTCIEKQIIGDHPIIDNQVGVDEGVPMQYDFRDIYGTILQDWLGLEASEVQSILYPDVRTLPLFKPRCVQSTSINQDLKDNEFEISLFPNPASNFIMIQLNSITVTSQISVFDGKGGLVDKFQNENKSLISLDISKYHSGSYFIHVQNRYVNKTKKFIKI
jgi:uncharacterized protein (DUF1501 family)